MANQNKIQILKLLTSEEGEIDDQEGTDVVQWLNNAHRLLLAEQDNELIINTWLPGRGKKYLVQQLLILLREAVLTQRWAAAIQVLVQLAAVPRTAAEAVWRVGCEAFQNCSSPSDHLVHQFSMQMKKLAVLNVKEVTTQHALLQISRNQLEDAAETLRGRLQTQAPRRAVTDKELYVKELKGLYQGLVYYNQWLVLKTKLETHQEEDATLLDGEALPSADESLYYSESKMKGLAEKACNSFEDLETKTGVWDLFITKYVELLIYQDESDKAIEVLKNYAANHPDNPNVWRCLYQYAESANHKGDAVTALRNYCQRVPSNSLTMKYVSRVNSSDSTETNYQEIVPLLFDTLDFYCNKNLPSAWYELASVILKIRAQKCKEGLDAVETCWAMRKNWWPAYHFDPDFFTKGHIPQTATSVRVTNGDNPADNIGNISQNITQESEIQENHAEIESGSNNANVSDPAQDDLYINGDEINPQNTQPRCYTSTMSERNSSPHSTEQFRTFVLCKAVVAQLLCGDNDFTASVSEYLRGFTEGSRLLKVVELSEQ